MTWLKWLLGTATLIGLLMAVFLYWAYRPVPVFQPLDYEPVPLSYWPTAGWRYSTPERQGMRSSVLANMIERYQRDVAQDPELFLDSVLVVRNGYVVADAHFNPRFPRDELHIIHSAVKSVISALVGIAIREGHIPGVDTPVVELFPDRHIQHLDARKRALTVADLLSMESGLHSRDSYLYGHAGLLAMQASDDWVQFALDLPMATQPGERFDYSNIATFLLAAIIEQTSGQDTLSFARRHLFQPLGIRDVRWEWNAAEQPLAWARMWLKPEAMAKFGLLYLQQGVWEGKQIVPRAWVRESITPHAYPQNAVDVLASDFTRDQEASSRNWVAQRFVRPFTDGYGYQWWLDRAGHFNALGYNGQYIIVAPAENLVVVVTAKSAGIAQFYPATLFEEYILPAVSADGPLSEDRAGQARLAALAGPPDTQRQTKTVAPLPTTAATISGVTYATTQNRFSTDNLCLTFASDQAYATISYTAREDWAASYRIGLDNRYRMTPTPVGTFAAVGEWVSPTRFHSNVELVGYSSFDRWEFAFDRDGLTVVEQSLTGRETYQGSPVARGGCLEPEPSP